MHFLIDWYFPYVVGGIYHERPVLSESLSPSRWAAALGPGDQVFQMRFGA